MQRTVVAAFALCAGAGLWHAAAAGSQDQPAFRTGVVLVPIDVRVLDRKGEHVTDLTPGDFTITEDGVPQRLAHFSTHGFGREAPGAPVPAASTAGLVAPESRTFAIVLDRGNLQAPVNALDGLIAFTRSLDPADRVAVIAYRRVLPPTTDHRGVIRLLERYRDRHERIEHLLTPPRTFDQRVVTTFAPEVRAAIDDVFAGRDLPRFEDLPGGAGHNRGAFSFRAALVPAIEYLRHVDGEKHVIFVSEQPLRNSWVTFDPDDDYFVQYATAARVALHLIRTGGIVSPAQQISRNGERLNWPRADDAEVFGPADLRALSAHTGGTSAYYEPADTPLARLDRLTRFQYLLAYYPTDPSADDRQRRVTVTVNRPGVTLHYRHGYQARPRGGTVDEFRQVFTDRRIQRAASWLAGPQHRPPGFPAPAAFVRVKAHAPETGSGAREIRLDIAFDGSRFTFLADGGVYRATVDVAVFLDSVGGSLLREKRDRVELQFDAAQFRRLSRDWIEFTTTVEAPPAATHARVVVYEYESDRTRYLKVALPRRR
jgi:VWFA-related protein